jgi:menaquinone-dependent protoporphyrinogen oxidase
MNVIVIYKSRYGSTRGIAEFIAEKLREHGVKAEARSVDTALDIEEYDAVVIGNTG